MIRIGAHVPTAGGLLNSVEYAVSTACETVQLFAKSPRRWAAPPTDPRSAADFRSACASEGIGPVFTHASYLINMGAESDELWERSIAALADELVRGHALGVAGVVIHLGRRYSDDDEACIERLTQCAVRAATTAGDACAPLLLENSAGAGRQFGSTLGEMSAALASVRAAGVDAALCFDTCHAFAAGIEVRTAVGWSEALDGLCREVGRVSVRLVHANDCKGEFGSHKDRHEWIGDGHLGVGGFAAMLAQPGLATASVVVEMPGDAPVKDAENVRRLKRLRDGDAETGDPGRARA